MRLSLGVRSFVALSRTLLMLMVLLAVGCRSQQTALHNPFMTPDKVPPPSTRTLTPGTAQPFYGGQAPAYQQPAYQQPVIQDRAAPGNWPTAPQQTPYTQHQGYGVRPSSAELPIGQSDDPANGRIVPIGSEAVRVPTDEQRLRFAMAERNETTPPRFSDMPASQSPVTPRPAAPLVDNTILPTPQSRFSANQMPANQQAASYGNDPARLRAVSPVGYDRQADWPIQNRVANTQSVQPNARDLFGDDGFRPQGSTPPFDSGERNAFERPTSPWQRPMVESPGQTAGSTDQFGMGPTYEWLRGKLVYSPETGQWRVVYMPEGSQPDQLGGSVVVANPQLLANLQSGDYVMVSGQLYNLQNPQNAFAPVYQLSGVQQQRR